MSARTDGRCYGVEKHFAFLTRPAAAPRPAPTSELRFVSAGGGYRVTIRATGRVLGYVEETEDGEWIAYQRRVERFGETGSRFVRDLVGEPARTRKAAVELLRAP